LRASRGKKWRYDAFERAAYEMMERNPENLSDELEKITPPDEYKYLYGLGCFSPVAGTRRQSQFFVRQ